MCNWVLWHHRIVLPLAGDKHQNLKRLRHLILWLTINDCLRSKDWGRRTGSTWPYKCYLTTWPTRDWPVNLDKSKFKSNTHTGPRPTLDKCGVLTCLTNPCDQWLRPGQPSEAMAISYLSTCMHASFMIIPHMGSSESLWSILISARLLDIQERLYQRDSRHRDKRTDAPSINAHIYAIICHTSRRFNHKSQLENVTNLSRHTLSQSTRQDTLNSSKNLCKSPLVSSSSLYKCGKTKTCFTLSSQNYQLHRSKNLQRYSFYIKE